MLILLSLIIVIILMIISSSKFNIHPFLSLLGAAIIMGFIGGLTGNEVVTYLMNGFGKTLGSIGLIIAFGTIIGTYLEKSGGAMALANWVLKIVGKSKSPLALNLTGFIVSIPVFCDSGFIILSSLLKAISRKSKISMVVLAVSLAAGLYVSHVFVPPTPGPLAATAALDANLGLVILLGILVAIPVSLTGMFWAKFIGKRMGEQIDSGIDIEKELQKKLPKTSLSFAPILVPLLLISLNSIAAYPSHPFGEGKLSTMIQFIGHPIMALLIGVALSFKLKPKKSKENHSHWVGEGLKQAGVIILITGAGGAFGAVLRATGIGDVIGESFADMDLGLLLPFIIAAVLKSAQGSSTVAIITTAAIMAPILGSFGLDTDMGRALSVLAVGAGAMTVSHINDSYFWVVAQFSEMDTKTALKSYTVATLLQGVVGIGIVFVLGLVLL